MSANKLVLPTIAVAVACFSATGKVTEKKQSKPLLAKPNVIYILADDLGYGELGCYGQQKIETPNIDRLAANGIRFTQHYSGAPVCAPSRCVLLTGKHLGHAAIRGNDEWGSRGKVWDYRAMIADSTLEGQSPMPDSEITFAQLLKTAGYTNGIVGKWGLGAPQTNCIPTRKGFDFFYGYNCQRQAHTYYPVHLYKNERRVYLGNDTVAPNTLLDKGVDPYNPDSYRKFTLKNYAPDLMFNEITGFVDENKDRPFFLFWTTTIPHAAIQAPKKWVDYYVKKFGDEKPYLGDKGYFPHRYPHAGYAAMISYLDEQIGKLVQQLKDLGIYENTLIIFTSDNGPTYNGGTDSPWFNSAGPFNCNYGWGKGFTHEGGIRVPMIASWPAQIKKARISDHISGFQDVMPTLCDIANVKTPESADGISFLATLKGQKQKEHQYLYWEFFEGTGEQAIRMGKWKGIRDNIKKGNMKITLYDLESDIQEQKDVSSAHPDVVKQMEQIMLKEHTPAVNERFRVKELGD